MNAISIIEYNISQNIDEHTLKNVDIADMIQDIINCVKDDIRNDTDVFASKYTRLMENLRNS